METGGGVSRRRMLAAEQKLDSPNLRDFLRVKEESNSNGGSHTVAGLTLGAVLGREPRSATAELPHRTLLDIIRDEPFVSKENRKTWKNFTERLRLKLPVSAWTSTVSISAPAGGTIPLQRTDNRMTEASHSARFSAANSASHVENPSEGLVQPELTTPSEPRRQSDSGSATLIVLLQRNSSRAVDRGSSRFPEMEVHGESREASGGEGRGDQPARLSLMALLAETDREMGIDGAAYVLGEEEVEDETTTGNKLIVDQCCVCMVRQKGAAFIPCGHTFCRLCSRELWVQRGSCPLCNNSISEILDIF